MSRLAHATLAAPGLEAEKRALADRAQHECREAARIQAQTGCTRTEALKLAAKPRGRPPICGRYSTREELEQQVFALYARPALSIAAVARITRVSAATVTNILSKRGIEPTKP